MGMGMGAMCPGGLIGATADHLRRASGAPSPEASLAAAMAVTGTLAGPRVRTGSGLRANLYVFCLGEPDEAGRTAEAVKRLMAGARLDRFIDMNPPMSQARLMRGLANSPCRLQVTTGRAARLLGDGGMLGEMCRLFSDDGPWTKIYADPRKDFTVEGCHLSLCAFDRPGAFWKRILKADVGGRFLGRVLTLSGGGGEGPRASPAPPPSVTGALRRLARHGDELSREGRKAAVRQSPEAEAASDRFVRSQARPGARGSSLDLQYPSVRRRALEHMLKLSLLAAVSRSFWAGDGLPERVEGKDAEWAAAFLGRMYGDMASMLSWHMEGR
jgi:hypothetical protein